MSQVVLPAGNAFVRGDTALWAHPYIPSYFVLVSIIILTLQIIFSSKQFRRHHRGISATVQDAGIVTVDESSSSSTQADLVSAVKNHVRRSGGSFIFLFQLSRLLLVLALLCLSIFSFLQKEEQQNVNFCGGPDPLDTGKYWGNLKKHKDKHRHDGGSFTEREWLDLALCLTYLYAFFLSLVTVTARRSRASLAAFHLTSLLFLTFSVYAYRDVWPLLTFTLTPVDWREGLLLWVKIGLLAGAGVIIPLTIPRQYVPFDLKAGFQTASRLSMTTYTFLDPVVFMAYRVSHLSHDMLPPLVDHDYAKNLVEKYFKHLDAFSGAPRRHLLWGFLTIFRKGFFQMAILLIVRVISTLMAPVGMNQLLRYLESRGEGAVVRPWVWIAFLFLGPALGAISFQWYLFIATGTLLRVSALVTQLVFEHALRIRVNVETCPSTRTIPAVTPKVLGETTTLHNVSLTSNNILSETTGESSVESEQSTTPSIIKGKQKEDSSATPDGEDSSEGPGKSNNLVGKMNNLVSTDLDNLLEGRDFLLFVFYLPLQVALCIWLLYRILGWSAFVGMVVMVTLFPIPGVITKKFQKVQKESMKWTDARVQTATEAMSILRMIKLFGWEPKIAARLAEKREHELKYIKLRQILNLINGNIKWMIVTYVTYVCRLGSFTIASAVFPSMAVFDLLRDQLHGIFLLTSTLIQAKVSLDRVDHFLHNTELLDEHADVKKGDTRALPTDASHFYRDVIGFRNASFTWSNDDVNHGSTTPSRRKFTLRLDDELLFKRGCFNLITGPTGSGKTSLLMALLGEMHFIPMSPDAWYHLPRSGGVSYAVQESWVQNESIRNNILFGTPYDEERYNKVIYQCSLQRDLKLFGAGDKTEVGEKGLTLSGGQKARVTLARAIYSSAEILILDDVLAALDVHTARWIVEMCFKGDLIRGRTVLLVTHNVAMASTLADYVVVLSPDGRVASRGSVSDAITKDPILAAEVVAGIQAGEDVETRIDQDEPDVTAKQEDDKLMIAEEIAEGHVSWDAFRLFLASLGGSHIAPFWIAFSGCLLLCDAFLAAQTWLMGWWAEQYGLYPQEKVSVTFYLTIYGLILLGSMICYTTGSYAYVFGAQRASRSIHGELIEAVLGTTLRRLDTTPTSRVIARVTQDIRALDNSIPNTFIWLIEISVAMLIKFTAVVYLTPVFIIPGVITATLGASLGHVYMKAQIAIKREMSNAKAPVLGHFGAAVAGLSSIRAYGAQFAFREESYRRIDRYMRAGRSFYDMNRWISLRVDFLGGLFAAALAAFLVYVPNRRVLPSDTGFSLNMAIGFSSMIFWWVRVFNNFEVNCNSLERLHSYINIEQEPKPTKQGMPPAYWPASGDLRVEHLSARYSLGGSKVLHDISFHIKSGELVGIVGRTGSGKSSLTLSLLRCIFTEGDVYYDGKLTSSINLDALRSNITIIPQTPELLSGTLRENLDPFSQHDDATLNGALRASGLFSLQSGDDEGRLTLDSEIASAGSNLSVGQRQILALARAIVRGSKLLIFDEDYKTDTIIQTSLRNELRGDVTLITIAHRLQTIIDADKVMVLDAGRVVEFDKPSELLKKENGRFRSLVDESGDKDLLYAMANQAGLAHAAD
ncbi:hypothetical protein BJV74DRAFT_879749 [Russula compacta]|nr:hypothetical protein BJV74DRAFT_879749 [Russula compacta]